MKRLGRSQRHCCVCHNPIEDEDQILLCIIFKEPYYCKGCTPRPDQTRQHPEGNGPVPEMTLVAMNLTIRAFIVLLRAGITNLSELRANTQESLTAAGVAPKVLDEIQDWMLEHSLSLLA